MLRITELKLPLDHDTAALPAAIVERLGIDAADLLCFSVFKRSYDARKKANILLIYQLDVELSAGLEQRLLEIGDWLRVNGEAIYGTRHAGRDALPRAPY